VRRLVGGQPLEKKVAPPADDREEVVEVVSDALRRGESLQDGESAVSLMSFPDAKE